MTRRRWIADECSGDRASLLGKHAEHLARVLRAQVGQTFEIAAGGVVRHGTVTHVATDRVEFALGEALQHDGEPNIAVALAIFKFDRFEWAIEKLVELGAASILPFAAARSDSHLLSAAAKRVERWRRVALSASEQSRRAAPPEIQQVAQFREVLGAAAAARIVLSEAARAEQGLSGVVRGAELRGGDRLLIAIGPEGGWTAGELEQFEKNGWKAASLGASILRAETA